MTFRAGIQVGHIFCVERVKKDALVSNSHFEQVRISKYCSNVS
jgi:hypothetical protein